MPLYNFGTGTVIGRRNGVDYTNTAITTPTPARFATMQDIDISFDRTLKELIGQNTYPVDIAGAATKIAGKGKIAGMQANFFNDMFFGQALSSGAGELVAVDESHTAAATITVTPPSSGTFVHDLGVFYQATGLQLTRTGSAPAVGSYEVTEPGGAYTFNATEAGTLLISYTYSITTATSKQIVITNQLMGLSPSFEMHFQMNYPNSASTTVNTLNLKLYACKASKLDFPFKNQDHTLPSLDFMAFADASGNVAQLTLPQ